MLINLKGWNLLAQNIATTAFHNSAERYDVPLSVRSEHKTTQTDITSIINLKEDTPSSRIVWVNGPSATSYIAQNIADSCISPVTFFFRQSEDAIHPLYATFIPTIAYQLCLLVPGARTLVSDAIERDPAILSRSVSDQLRELILVPFASLQKSQSDFPENLSHPVVIIVDCIHYCSVEHQQVVIHALLDIIANLAYPTTLVLASAPNSEIALALNYGKTSERLTIITIPTSSSSSARGLRPWLVIFRIALAIKDVFIRYLGSWALSKSWNNIISLILGFSRYHNYAKS